MRSQERGEGQVSYSRRGTDKEKSRDLRRYKSWWVARKFKNCFKKKNAKFWEKPLRFSRKAVVVLNLRVWGRRPIYPKRGGNAISTRKMAFVVCCVIFLSHKNVLMTTNIWEIIIEIVKSFNPWKNKFARLWGRKKLVEKIKGYLLKLPCFWLTRSRAKNCQSE